MVLNTNKSEIPYQGMFNQDVLLGVNRRRPVSGPVHEINFQEGDNIVIKKLYKPAIPTNSEIKMLIDLFPIGSPHRIALIMMIAIGPRPVELCNMNWNKLGYCSKKNRIQNIKHYVYKAGSRLSNKSRTYFIKEVQKPINSTQLSNELISYRQSNMFDHTNRIFPWSNPDALNKQFTILRKKVMKRDLGPEYDFLLDKVTETVAGQSKTQYRVSLYSLRRFCITFHYYTTFKQDVIALAQYTGHSSPDNLLKHYIKPKETIGLTDEMIDANITIDQFINLGVAGQSTISDFIPARELGLPDANQATLWNFN